MSETPFLSMRDAVLEIRDDVKELTSKLDRIDREGSIGTKAELEDHEKRLRSLEGVSFRLAGAWGTLVIAGSFLAGLIGLVLGVLAFIGV